MLKGGAFGETIGVAGRDVETIQQPGLLYQGSGDGDLGWKFPQESGNDVPPCFLSVMQVEGLYRFLGGLLGSEACPFVPPRSPGILCLLQVPLRLAEPVLCPLYHKWLTLW